MERCDLTYSVHVQDVSCSSSQEFLKYLEFFEARLSTASSPPLMALRQVSRIKKRYSIMQLQLDEHRITALLARDLERLFALLSAYRLVDVIAMVRGSSYSTGVPQHRRQKYLGDKTFLLSKGWGFMEDWCQLLIEARDTMLFSTQHLPNLTGCADPHSLRLVHLKTAGNLLSKSSTFKILLNVQLAAMHVAHLFMSPGDSEVSLYSNP